MFKKFGLKNQNSLNFNTLEQPHSPNTMETFNENSNSHSLVNQFNAFENLFKNEQTKIQPIEEITPDLDLKDLSIYREIIFFSNDSFEYLNLNRDIEKICENYHFSPKSMAKEVIIVTQDIFRSIYNAYMNYTEHNKWFYILSLNFSVLFIGKYCLLATKNKNQQKTLEKNKIAFRQYNQQLDHEINENSLSFFSDSEELFLIQNKHIQLFFEYLLNDLIHDNSYELISEKEFHLSKKVPFRIKQNQRVEVNLSQNPEFRQLVKRNLQPLPFIETSNTLYKIKLEGALNVHQISELQNAISIRNPYFKCQMTQLETTRLFHQKLLQ